jgi:hypothetical protein
MAGPKPFHRHGSASVSSAEIIAVPCNEGLHSFFQGRFWGKISESQKQRSVGEGEWNVAFLHRHEIALGPYSGRGLDGGDEIHERDRCRGADVDDPPRRDGGQAVIRKGRSSSFDLRRRMANEPEYRFDDIVDIGKVPAHFAIIIDINWATLEKRGGKFEKCHVRASPGAVNREKSQHCDRDFEEVALLTGTKRMEGRRTASQTASASATSCLLRFT